MSKILETSDGMKVERVSKWIKIRASYVTPKHRLHGYSDEGTLLYFKYDGDRYALGQFMRFDFGPSAKKMYVKDGKEDICLAGYDATEYYRPLMIEINSTGEAVRLYREAV